MDQERFGGYDVSNEKRVRDHFAATMETQERARDVLAEPVAAAAERLAATLKAGGKILVCGNGGSAADAQHFAAEFTNRFERERPPLAAIALTTDTSALTAIGNDYHFDQVFAKQVQALARAGDALVAISTSGGSTNIAAAVEAAHAADAWVLALSGRDGGKLAAALGADDMELRVPAERTAHIQEVHIVLLHCLCDLVDATLYPE
ncbi:MAG: phosphoheptose isomerase [Gammaproteobacteria bacterium]